ncbi:hypothetical protein BB558_002793, partial [Smittium angustum]
MKLFALFLLFVLTLVSSAPIPDQNVFRVIKKLAIKRLRFTTVTQTIDATSILITVLRDPTSVSPQTTSTPTPSSSTDFSSTSTDSIPFAEPSPQVAPASTTEPDP